MEEQRTPAETLAMLMKAAQGNFTAQLADELSSQTFVGGKRVPVQPLPKFPAKLKTRVFQVKVTLYGSKPPVWRRLEIPCVMTLDQVDDVMKIAFGWWEMHLHCFETVCGRFASPEEIDDSWGEPDKDERIAALGQVLAEAKDRVVYTYDFGDDWRHDIVLERVLPARPGIAYPRCTAGKGQPPEEDSGGVWAFNTERVPGEDLFDPDELTAALEGIASVVVAELCRPRIVGVCDVIPAHQAGQREGSL